MSINLSGSEDQLRFQVEMQQLVREAPRGCRLRTRGMSSH